MNIFKSKTPSTVTGTFKLTLEEPTASGYPVSLSVPTEPVPPEPDLASKPKDIVGYYFGFSCPKKHIQDIFDSITVDGYGERRACGTCGAVSKPCVVKRTAEAQWGDQQNYIRFSFNSQLPKPCWGWSQHNKYTIGTRWTKSEFFHYLETPKTKRK